MGRSFTHVFESKVFKRVIVLVGFLLVISFLVSAANETNITTNETDILLEEEIILADENSSEIVNETDFYNETNVTEQIILDEQPIILNETNETIPDNNETNITVEITNETQEDEIIIEEVSPTLTRENEEEIISATQGIVTLEGITSITYIYAGSLIASRSSDNPSQVDYYIQDHLGSNRKIIEGVMEEQSNDYYAFGEDKITTGTSDNNYKYTGKEKDDDTGLYYYGARYYSPSIGRFVQADVVRGGLADPLSLNRYAYVRNNPLNFVDPTGNQGIDFNNKQPADKTRVTIDMENANAIEKSRKDSALTQRTRVHLKATIDPSILNSPLASDSTKTVSDLIGEVEVVRGEIEKPSTLANYNAQTNTITTDTLKAPIMLVETATHEGDHLVQSALGLKESDYVNTYNILSNSKDSMDVNLIKTLIYSGYGLASKVSNINTRSEIGREIVPSGDARLISGDPRVSSFMNSNSYLSQRAKTNTQFQDSLRIEFERQL